MSGRLSDGRKQQQSSLNDKDRNALLIKKQTNKKKTTWLFEWDYIHYDQWHKQVGLKTEYTGI